jgi:trehalose 2-sulfotransferase
LLCDLLSGTGIAGQPQSYYRREDILDYARAWGVSSRNVIGDRAFERAYLEAVRRAGAAETGIFGLRLMWSSVAELSARLSLIHPDAFDDAARFELAFGKPLYIHLSRQDKVAQAISLLRARQSGLWHRAADGTERERLAPPAPLVYDADRLAGLVEELETDDAAWNGWFSRFGIEPLRLTYEGLAAKPQAALAQVLSALALDEATAASVDVRTAKLADETSLEWTRRFRAGSGARQNP